MKCILLFGIILLTLNLCYSNTTITVCDSRQLQAAVHKACTFFKRNKHDSSSKFRFSQTFSRIISGLEFLQLLWLFLLFWFSFRISWGRRLSYTLLWKRMRTTYIFATLRSALIYLQLFLINFFFFFQQIFS
jgi:hypothetical protein